MPVLNMHPQALDDLRRLYGFLAPKNSNAAQRAINTITGYLDKLETSPYLGSYYDEYRKLVIPFGRAAYFAFYHFEKNTGTVHVVHISHSREDIKLPSLSTLWQ